MNHYDAVYDAAYREAVKATKQRDLAAEQRERDRISKWVKRGAFAGTLLTPGAPLYTG